MAHARGSLPRSRRPVPPRAGLVLGLLLGLVAAGPASAADVGPVDVRIDAFTEAAAIPYTRLAGARLNPGATAGIGWTWAERGPLAFGQTASVLAFSHGRIERGVLLRTEVWLRGTTSLGPAAELGAGAGYLHAFSGGPVYARDDSGSYAQVRDWGRPRFSPTFHVGLGHDFSRRGDLPLSLFVVYGFFGEIPYSSTQFPVLPHTTLGLSLRYTLSRSAP